MVVTFEEAQNILAQTAAVQRQKIDEADEIPVVDAVGRVSRYEILSPVSTPPFDTSAMDGFALSSDVAASASHESPLRFCVGGMLAAGDAPFTVVVDPADDVPPCVEIMTGAQFPTPSPDHSLDACVKIEDTLVVPGPSKRRRYIQIQQTVRKDQNRRYAGSDFCVSQPVLSKDQIIEPSHVMALASLGISHMKVRRRLRVGVLCTGSELVPHDAQGTHINLIRNSNGPYIIGALKVHGALIDDLGTVRDDPIELVDALTHQLHRAFYDVLITTGAVSVGKFDMVPDSLAEVGAEIKFHKVGMRPGAPILHATWSAAAKSACSSSGQILASSAISYQNHSTAIFGLPGNPMATALGLRMFVVPYLRMLDGSSAEVPIYATVEANPVITQSSGDMMARLKGRHCEPNGDWSGQTLLTKPDNMDFFRHGRLSYTQHGVQVAMTTDQGASKVKPWLEANCWVHIPRSVGSVKEGDMLCCFLFNAY